MPTIGNPNLVTHPPAGHANPVRRLQADELPPFAGLRLIEAACRHRSYTRAACECHVTHPAITAQVQRLEARFGIILFEKDRIGMRPTEAAWELARAYVEARYVLGRAFDRLPAKSMWPQAENPLQGQPTDRMRSAS